VIVERIDKLEEYKYNYIMEVKKTNKQLYKKFDGTGQFPTDAHGKIINNRATGYDPSKYSFEVFKKTVKEKLDLATAKSKWKSFMRMSYGKNWKRYNNPTTF
jgi:hypothetical protein